MIKILLFATLLVFSNILKAELKKGCFFKLQTGKQLSKDYKNKIYLVERNCKKEKKNRGPECSSAIKDLAGEFENIKTNLDAIKLDCQVGPKKD